MNISLTPGFNPDSSCVSLIFKSSQNHVSDFVLGEKVDYIRPVNTVGKHSLLLDRKPIITTQKMYSASFLVLALAVFGVSIQP